MLIRPNDIKYNHENVPKLSTKKAQCKKIPWLIKCKIGLMFVG